jgi:uridine phosphorylase
MYHAGVEDPVFFRIGTCGGIGIDGGSVIITQEAVNCDLEPEYEVTALGRKIKRSSTLDTDLCHELMSIAESMDEPYTFHMGKTMCTDDFYEGI